MNKKVSGIYRFLVLFPGQYLFGGDFRLLRDHLKYFGKYFGLTHRFSFFIVTFALPIELIQLTKAYQECSGIIPGT